MEQKTKVPPLVYVLSVISFFNDIASEMLYPILPIFLTQILGAPVFVVGIIEGIAEGLAAFLKSYFGFLSDKYQSRKPFIVIGYGLSTLSKIIIASAYHWVVVFIARSIDRVGKGVRTGPRDALLLDAASKNNKGKIFGLHRAFDSAGAIIGPLITLYLLSQHPNNIRLILYVAILPAIATLLLFYFISESKTKIAKTTKQFSFFKTIKIQSHQLRLFFIILAVFSLGNSSDSFLILKAKSIGLQLTTVVMVYIVYNIVYALLSTPAGILADRLGAKKIFLVGLVIYTLVYIGFALNTSTSLVWLLFAVYGGYIALTDGVSRALIGTLIEKEQGATIYGMSQTLTSISTLLASIIAGILWSAISPMAPFFFGAFCSLSAILLFLFL
jgi:MFS family permease